LANYDFPRDDFWKEISFSDKVFVSNAINNGCLFLRVGKEVEISIISQKRWTVSHLLRPVSRLSICRNRFIYTCQTAAAYKNGNAMPVAFRSWNLIKDMKLGGTIN
jgi:hypothetical protein